MCAVAATKVWHCSGRCATGSSSGGGGGGFPTGIAGYGRGLCSCPKNSLMPSLRFDPFILSFLAASWLGRISSRREVMVVGGNAWPEDDKHQGTWCLGGG